MSRVSNSAADETLRRALAMTGKLLENTSTGIFAFDREGRYIFWSTGMERLSGVTAQEVLDRSALDCLPFLARGGNTDYIARTISGEDLAVRNRPYLFSELRRSGFYDAFYTPLHADDGSVVGGIALLHDITERKQAAQRIEETERRFKNMANAAPVLLWMSGEDSLCTFFNQSWLDFTGRTLEQEWGVGWAEGVHFEDFQRCMDTYVAAFNERRVFEIEYRLRRADGAYRWILDRGTPRYSPDGQFAGYIGSCVDITERKQLEEDLRKAVRDRDEFLSIASHELRTPLTGLQLEIESLLRTLDKRPEEGLRSGRLRKNADVARGQTDRMTRLIDQLLDVSRIASGRLLLQLESLDIAALTREIVHRMKPTFDAAECSVTLSADSPVVGVWDKMRIEQVVTNLLTNAAKYGEGRPVEVCVRLMEGGRRAELIVSDRGIGIALEDQARIFERFERAVPSNHFGGFGLGLWISRRIVEAMDGTIGVRSTLREGATFLVELPVLEPPDDGNPLL